MAEYTAEYSVFTRYVTEVVRSGPNWSETTSAQSWAETRLTQSISGTFTPTAAARLTKRNETHLDPPRAEMGGGIPHYYTDLS